MKIAFVIGTRPEYIKVIPVYKQFRNSSNFDAILVSTGQHTTMLDGLFKFFEIRPDVELKSMVEGQSLGQLSSRLHLELDDCYDQIKPDLVMVQGDTTTSFIAALAAYYKKIPVAHIEAGLRTRDKYSPFPEEINRKIISTFSELNFCPTAAAKSNLISEGINAKTFVVGNTVIDSLLWAKEKIELKLPDYEAISAEILKTNNKIVLITAHRRENHGEGIKGIVTAIRTLATKYLYFNFVIPVHLNPNVERIIKSELGDLVNVHLLNPLPYDHLVYLMSKAYIVLTDSGGIQEEAPSLNVPVLVMREDTERMEGIEANTCKLVGTDPERIISAFEWLFNSDNYKSMASSVNPYGDGTTSQQIEKILVDLYS